MVKVRPGGRRGTRPSHGPEGRWLIALPAWGDRCVNLLLRYTLPALIVAVKEMARPTDLLIWTDQVGRVKEALLTPELNIGAQCTILPVPGTDLGFESMSSCHRRALTEAGPQDRVVLLTADMVVSREILSTAARLCAHGTKAVCCAAPRTLETANPPIGATGRELLNWAWENRHPMTRECTWPSGRSYDVSRMYFEEGEEVAARVMLPHPLVVVPQGRTMEFRPTIDVNLAANFSSSVTHLITTPEEGAVVELSPADKEFLMTDSMATRMQTRGPSAPSLIACHNPRHRMFYSKKIILRGDGGDCGDATMVGRILG